ncbi:MAG: endonuclease domain-containing protein [Rhizomicrobium sp.]
MRRIFRVGDRPLFQRDTEAASRARTLRLGATRHERRLWRELRMLNRIGYHFRRRVSLCGFIADFAVNSRKLVIELNGSQHGLEPRHARDGLRDKAIEEHGYQVLRFWNRELDQDIHAVVARIVHELGQRPPTRKRFAFWTSPQGGGAP